MTQTNPKRILWTITVLIALSLLAVMVLHKHEKPKIIGKLSQADVSDISRATLDFDRESKMSAAKLYLKGGQIGNLLELLNHYPIVSIEAIDSEDVLVLLGTATNQIEAQYSLEREGSRWNVVEGPIY